MEKLHRPNILLLMSDEHDPALMHCAGDPYVDTPCMDALAAAGVRYDSAYTVSPMCVPARMGFLSGRVPSQVRVYDNGCPLASEVPSFASYLTASGYETVLCGRMHMIGEDRTHGFGCRLYDDKSGWMNGRGQTPYRHPDVCRGSNSHLTDSGPIAGGSWHDYDNTAIDLAELYLKNKAALAEEGREEQPWLLTVGVMFPHFPMHAPPALYEKYAAMNIPLPETRHERVEEQHPILAQMRRTFCNDGPVNDEEYARGLASYYALVEHVDGFLGRLQSVVDNSPLRDNTIVVYLSDHGEMAGQHGVWQKQLFYESATRMPLIVRYPEAYRRHFGAAAPGSVVNSPVSMLDLFPSLLNWGGVTPPADLPGCILETTDPDRSVISEYHAQGMLHGGYMIRRGRYKYCHYVDAPPQLFCPEADPTEVNDLHGTPGAAAIEAELEAELRRYLKPDLTDRAALASQRKRLTESGRLAEIEASLAAKRAAAEQSGVKK